MTLSIAEYDALYERWLATPSSETFDEYQQRVEQTIERAMIAPAVLRFTDCYFEGGESLDQYQTRLAAL